MGRGRTHTLVKTYDKPAYAWETEGPLGLPESKVNPTRFKSAYKNSLLFNEKMRNVDLAERFIMDGTPELPNFRFHYVDRLFIKYLAKLDVQDIAPVCDAQLVLNNHTCKPKVSQTAEDGEKMSINDLEALRGHCRSMTIFLQGCKCKGPICRRLRFQLEKTCEPIKNWARDIVGGDAGVDMKEQRDGVTMRITIKVWRST
jgi:hypothetical protein